MCHCRELLGLDKTGIISTQFTMTGDVDDADVGINLFALAPALSEIF